MLLVTDSPKVDMRDLAVAENQTPIPEPHFRIDHWLLEVMLTL